MNLVQGRHTVSGAVTETDIVASHDDTLILLSALYSYLRAGDAFLKHLPFIIAIIMKQLIDQSATINCRVNGLNGGQSLCT